MSETTREDLQTSIWELYKDVHGIKPRWIQFDKMTAEEMQEMVDNLSAEAEIVFEEQRQYDAEALAEFEKTVADVKQMCNCGWHRAISYLMDAEGVRKGDAEHFFYCQDVGISNAMQLAKQFLGQK